jgi:DNA-binding NarL/FixJ family response regulator
MHSKSRELMHEAAPPATRARTARRGSKRRAVVCLLSANPLALPEMRRLARRSRFRVRTAHIRLSGPEVHHVRVPNASVYVIDAFSTGAMTEAFVAGLRTSHPRARLVALVDGLAEAQGIALLFLGVKGILKIREVEMSLGKAIAFVCAGGVWMPRGLMAKFLDASTGRSQTRRLSAAGRLSQRERQVFDRVVKNRSNKEIASELHISESTVKFHVARLFDKFGVRRRADLILQNVQEPGVVH